MPLTVFVRDITEVRLVISKVNVLLRRLGDNQFVKKCLLRAYT